MPDICRVRWQSQFEIKGIFEIIAVKLVKIYDDMIRLPFVQPIRQRSGVCEQNCEGILKYFVNFVIKGKLRTIINFLYSYM